MDMELCPWHIVCVLGACSVAHERNPSQNGKSSGRICGSMESKGEWDNRGLGRTTVSWKTATWRTAGIQTQRQGFLSICHVSLPECQSLFLTTDQIVSNRFGTQDRVYLKLSSFKFRRPKQGVYWPLYVKYTDQNQSIVNRAARHCDWPSWGQDLPLDQWTKTRGRSCLDLTQELLN